MAINRSPLRTHEHKCFYKYVTAEVAKIALVNRTLRWSSPLIFNDPSDVLREIEIEFKESELQETVATEVARIIENHELVPSSANPKLYLLLNILEIIGTQELRKLMVSEIRRFASEEHIINKGTISKLCTTWEQQIPQMRILSLSEVNDNMAMWWHYADKHKGVVLELECIDEIDSPWLVAKPVVYQETLPMFPTKEDLVRSITGLRPIDYKQLFSEFMYIKKNDWAYEKEWRVVSFARPGESGVYSDYSVNSLNFGAIYFGKDVREDDEKDIIALLTHDLSHMSAYKAVHNSVKRCLQFNIVR